MKRFIVVLALSLLSFPASAIVITQCSSPGTFTQNNGASPANCSNFDRAEFTFAGVFANSIQISNFGANAIFDIHGPSRMAEVDVLILGVWTNIFTSVSYNVSTLLSTVLAAPMPFIGATITGLRLDVNLPVRQRIFKLWHSKIRC